MPGSVTNPTGRNQWTYRKAAEEQFERLLRKATNDGRTVSEDIILGVLQHAIAQNPWAVDMVMKRILPPVEKHEHSTDESLDLSSLLARLAGFASARRTNGHDREADTSGTPGSNGSGV